MEHLRFGWMKVPRCKGVKWQLLWFEGSDLCGFAEIDGFTCALVADTMQIYGFQYEKKSKS